MQSLGKLIEDIWATFFFEFWASLGISFGQIRTYPNQFGQFRICPNLRRKTVLITMPNSTPSILQLKVYLVSENFLQRN